MQTVFKESWLETPLGSMMVIGNEEAIYLLEFADRRDLQWELQRLRTKHKAIIVPGTTPPIVSITTELKAYFEGTLKEFKTPLHLSGTPFQKSVWQELNRIPYGQTRSYAQQAEAMGKQKAYRAVANANGSNQIAIVIPCHRVITSNGELGGYGAGVERKKWLINHEKLNQIIIVMRTRLHRLLNCTI